MPRASVAKALTVALEDSATSLAECRRVGVDAVHIPTWERHLQLGGEALLRRIYTPKEIEFSAGRPDRLATRLAGKESVLKVLGTGIRGIGLIDVEVRSLPSGRPTVIVHGPARQATTDAGLSHVEISLCHEGEYALAVAIGVGKDGCDE
jgi:holo-[acyl-carrier protein] synthase